jgi:hypothetical protein
MIYVPSFIKIGSGIKVDRVDSQTHRMEIAYAYFRKAG